MSLERQISRNQVKKYYIENTKGVPKRYRTKFSDFWKSVSKKLRKRGF